MSFPRYPAYKDSGVEWLGEVPAHWTVCAVKRIAKLQSGESITADGIDEAGMYPVYGGNGLRGYTSSFTHDGHFVLIGRQGALCGNVNYATGRFFASEHAVVAYPMKPVAIGWLGEMFRSMNLNQYSISAAQPGLSVELVSNLLTVWPPLPEQTAISTFLMRERAKIDALIAEQQRLIELLIEKRRAVISHAVTKGLDPLVSMKRSSVEWLGDVPEHWAVAPIKFVTKIGNGSTPDRENPLYWRGGEYPWLSSTVVNSEVVVEAEEFVTLRALEECHLPKISPPAVLIGITGQGRTRGMATTLLIEATINQHVAFLKPFPSKSDVVFLRRVIDMAYPYLRRDSEAGGSTKGAITCEQIGNLKIALPPIQEQMEIVRSLARFLKALDALADEAKRAIDLLQQRRIALISAAVTGQIDLRDLALAEAA